VRLLAIDPGGTTGWAYFVEGKLTLCGAWPLERMSSEWCVPLGILDVVLVERPMIYPGAKAEAPDNDIVTLALRAGQLGGRYGSGGASLEYVLPRTWKGNLPKPAPGVQYVVEKRVLKVLDLSESRLLYSTMSARARKLDHNMVDAVGIGLWRLERKYRGEAQHLCDS
jgi:hypothetical protein